MPQWRSQVVGHAVGEGLQFLVAGAQLAGQLGHFLGLAQHDAKHRVAQLQRAFDFDLIPGVRITAQRLLPAFETVAGLSAPLMRSICFSGWPAQFTVLTCSRRNQIR